MSPDFDTKVSFDVTAEAERSPLKDATYDNLINLATNFSDGVVLSGENISKNILSNIDAKNVPILTFEESSQENAYIDFFNNKII